MTVRCVYNVDITPSERVTRWCQRYRWVRSGLVDVVMSFTPTREDRRCSCENCEESTSE